ncbi:MAG: glycosyltransferase family 10 [Porphyromonadaceae bacterium]|nr:glycosyltransferase family 10 [Porphyromonadaceae bacterium]
MGKVQVDPGMHIDHILQPLRDKRDLLLDIGKEFRLRKVYTGGLKFHNWLEEAPENNWFYRFCTHRGIEGPLKFFAVFGHPILAHFISGRKVFFSGENLHGLWGKYNHFRRNEHLYDLVLGFDPLGDSRHMRFPLWIQYLVAPEDSLEDIRAKIARINDIANRTNPERTKFACIMARHDGSGIRSQLGDLLGQVAPITYPGKFRNNTDELKTKYNDNKKKYLRNFRFNICPENSITLGYITEKLFEAIISGCIPIYWGGGMGYI